MVKTSSIGKLLIALLLGVSALIVMVGFICFEAQLDKECPKEIKKPATLNDLKIDKEHN